MLQHLSAIGSVEVGVHLPDCQPQMQVLVGEISCALFRNSAVIQWWPVVESVFIQIVTKRVKYFHC